MEPKKHNSRIGEMTATQLADDLDAFKENRDQVLEYGQASFKRRPGLMLTYVASVYGKDGSTDNDDPGAVGHYSGLSISLDDRGADVSGAPMGVLTEVMFNLIGTLATNNTIGHISIDTTQKAQAAGMSLDDYIEVHSSEIADRQRNKFRNCVQDFVKLLTVAALAHTHDDDAIDRTMEEAGVQTVLHINGRCMNR